MRNATAVSATNKVWSSVGLDQRVLGEKTDNVVFELGYAGGHTLFVALTAVVQGVG